MTNQELSTVPNSESRPLSLQEVVSQVRLIQEVLKTVMRQDEHYGIIPGTPKPTLYKAGAEKLCLTFRLAPDYRTQNQEDGNHLTITSTCTLSHVPTGNVMGSGMGSCSTRESKYAYRQSSRKCPKCGKETIIKGKAEFGGGWLCFAKKGGCGAKFEDTDKAITDQKENRVENPDIADQYNTVLKMSNKRALVAAVLNVTAASDIFTQDIEDLPEFAASPSKSPIQKPQAKTSPTPPASPVSSVNSNGDTVEYQIISVTPKSKNEGKEKKSWFEIVAANEKAEIKATTYSETFASVAGDCAKTGAKCRIVTVQKGQYLNVKSLEPVESADVAPAE